MTHGACAHAGTGGEDCALVWWVVRAGVPRASTDHRSIGHGIVGSATKEQEVETLNAPCQQVCLCVYMYMCLCEYIQC